MEVDEARGGVRGGTSYASGDSGIGERPGRFDGRPFEGRPNQGVRERDLSCGFSRGAGVDQLNKEADQQRLVESLLDPQDVPRSGYFFEVS